MSWRRFDREPERYEAWYATARGRRAFDAETDLLASLLDALPPSRSVLEVGCGCGRFTRWLADRGLRPIALDRAPRMLACLRRRLPCCPALLADAQNLPLRDRAVDLVVFVTSLEFVDDPRRALTEAVRVAGRGLVVLALNRCSLGGLSRRISPAARGSLLGAADDLSPRGLRRLLAAAAGPDPAGFVTRSALLPRPWGRGPTRLPFGDVIGIAAPLHRPASPLHRPGTEPGVRPAPAAPARVAGSRARSLPMPSRRQSSPGSPTSPGSDAR
jgi:SAM-dependent methyltransferase